MSKPIIPPEDAEKMAAVANTLAMSAMEGMLPQARTMPLYVVAVLSLALGEVAALCKVSYKDLIDLVGRHYENAQLRKMQREAEEIAARVGIKPPDPSKIN